MTRPDQPGYRAVMTRPDQQGYLGDLEDKSRDELVELLKKQQQLASMKKFMQRLPDKGAKIQAMIARLNALIVQQESVDDAASQFENLALNAERAHRQRTAQCDDEEESALLSQIINRGCGKKVYTTEESDIDGNDCSEATAFAWDQRGDDCGESATFVNAYDKVIRKADVAKPRARYLPNRSIHASNIHELVERIDNISVVSKEFPGRGTTTRVPTKGDTPGLKYEYDELLESSMPKSEQKYMKTKMISLTDAMELQLDQGRKHAEAQMRHAAERLATPSMVVMSAFQPEGAPTDSLRYREVRDEEDSDSDDDD